MRYICDTINVMYLGKIVERGPSEELFQRPLHPYTQALLAAVPVPDPALEADRPEKLVAGELPSPANPPAGCAFHTRCPIAMARCKEEMPALKMYGPRRAAACHALE